MKWIAFILCFAAAAHSQVRLEADAVTNATRYEFRLGQQSGRYTIILTSSVPSLVVSNLANGQWFAVITAHNASEACPWYELSKVPSWLDIFTPTEIGFVISTTVQLVDVYLLETTDAAAPRSTWTRVATNRMPASDVKKYYAMDVSLVLQLSSPPPGFIGPMPLRSPPPAP
jgi:hypothetical protein